MLTEKPRPQQKPSVKAPMHIHNIVYIIKIYVDFVECGSTDAVNVPARIKFCLHFYRIMV